MRLAAFAALVFLICVGLAIVLYAFVSWLVNDLVALPLVVIYLACCTVHIVRTFGDQHRRIRECRRRMREVDERWTPAGVKAQLLEMIEERHNPQLRKRRPDLDLTQAHGGQPCPFCGDDVYVRQDQRSFKCLGCSSRFTVLSDKTGPFYFCEGRKMTIEAAMDRFLLSRDQAEAHFPRETVMIDDRPGRYA